MKEIETIYEVREADGRKIVAKDFSSFDRDEMLWFVKIMGCGTIWRRVLKDIVDDILRRDKICEPIRFESQ